MAGRTTAKAETRRFRATIKKQGPNPYVEVPEGVSRALAEFARASRISVEGKLNGATVRATLVPAGKGRHRLYVNGGMRRAAGVGVGDTVSFELRGTSYDEVRPPEDVAGALLKVESAAAAFDALSPSHRRELLRYVDDARSLKTRQRRIQSTIEHVLGGETPGKRKAPDRPLWTCPKCGNEFVNKNQYHSCGRYSLSDLFAGKPEHIRRIFDRFREMVEACGPIKVLPYRDMVGFVVRVRFAGAVPKTQWLDIGLWLPRRVEHARFHKVETIYPNAHTHVLRVADAGQLDEEVAGWTREAYALGCQRPLASSGDS